MGASFAIAGLSACLLFLSGPKGPSKEEIRKEVARLGSESDEERTAALERLSKMGTAAAMTVAESLRGAPEAARPGIAQLLGIYRSVETVPLVAKHLEREKSLNLRRQLIRALGKIGKRASAEALAEQLEREGEIAGKRDCLLALAETGSPRGMDTLLSFAEATEEEYLRETSLKALKQLSKRDLGKDLAPWRAWWKKHREDVLKRAGEWDEPESSNEG